MTERIYRALVASEQERERIVPDRLEWCVESVLFPPRLSQSAADLWATVANPNLPKQPRTIAALWLSFLQQVEQRQAIPVTALHLSDRVCLLHLPGEAFVIAKAHGWKPRFVPGKYPSHRFSRFYRDMILFGTHNLAGEQVIIGFDRKSLRRVFEIPGCDFLAQDEVLVATAKHLTGERLAVAERTLRHRLLSAEGEALSVSGLVAVGCGSVVQISLSGPHHRYLSNGVWSHNKARPID